MTHNSLQAAIENAITWREDMDIWEFPAKPGEFDVRRPFVADHLRKEGFRLAATIRMRPHVRIEPTSDRKATEYVR